MSNYAIQGSGTSGEFNWQIEIHLYLSRPSLCVCISQWFLNGDFKSRRTSSKRIGEFDGGCKLAGRHYWKNGRVPRVAGFATERCKISSHIGQKIAAGSLHEGH